MRIRQYIVIALLLVVLPLKIYGLSIEEEKKYGAQIYSEIANSATINNDPYISMHLRFIKERLESVVAMPYHVVLTVIESPNMDAFATIGGFVYITTGLISQCDREEELAGVVAHEFAHLARRHIAKRYEKEKYLNIGMLSSIALAMLAGDAKTQEAVLATGIASAQSMALKYSREDEDEADRFGSKFADSAGYGGFGIAEFLKKLRLAGGDKVLPQYLLTHPYHEERIIRLESLWPNRKPIPDSPIFPYIIVRAKVLNKIRGTQSDDIWINRYTKDKKDPLNAYAAYLVYSRRGRMDDALEAIKNIDSPVKDLILGEALLTAGKLSEAVDSLRRVQPGDSSYYISRIYLARAYEAQGERNLALDAWTDLLRYGNSFPEIFYRFAMLSGRMGMEARGFEYLGRYYLALGRLHLAKSNFEKAIAKYGINSKEAKELMRLLEDAKGPK
ncbi:MAG TPA: M48 family metalloprotease [Syntrophorhabdaceae bacterium]|nr:M48 family metalloprotease [Syntrophorhabdaceae bacterium]HPC66855.1 M48 family metalloprotease [Syntrophorhabdaceae bacterium]HQE79329.1 M48 family metalloprotease [Syntrophorhabdaceae bacterium]HRR72564.1 M48 family metalloprotease [Syntrophorhabdaceae bacterium]HRV22588.1 M48 family metalloprotease [Syntrophorhabdaceae bacterium]